MDSNQRLYAEDPAGTKGKKARHRRPPKHAHSWTPWGLPAEIGYRGSLGLRRWDWERHCRVCGKVEHGYWLMDRDVPDGVEACLEHQWEPNTWALDRRTNGGMLVEHIFRCTVCGDVDRYRTVREGK